MQAGDGARLRNADAIELSHGANAEVLVFDLRPNELPISDPHPGKPHEDPRSAAAPAPAGANSTRLADASPPA